MEYLRKNLWGTVDEAHYEIEMFKKYRVALSSPVRLSIFFLTKSFKSLVVVAIFAPVMLI
jgi:hypothetical protein